MFTFKHQCIDVDWSTYACTKPGDLRRPWKGEPSSPGAWVEVPLTTHNRLNGVAKTCAVRPVLAQGGGKPRGSTSKTLFEGAMKQMLVRGRNQSQKFRSGFVGWPWSTLEKGPQSNESYQRENSRNRTISTVLWVHKIFLKITVKLVLPSNEIYESRTGCSRTLATVLWAPLSLADRRGWREEILHMTMRIRLWPPTPTPEFLTKDFRMQPGHECYMLVLSRSRVHRWRCSMSGPPTPHYPPPPFSVHSHPKSKRYKTCFLHLFHSKRKSSVKIDKGHHSSKLGTLSSLFGTKIAGETENY